MKSSRSNNQIISRKGARGAYLLQFRLLEPANLTVGALGELPMLPGDYVYVGSARGGIEARVARHERLARTKTGKVHWHIDFMLVHPKCELIRSRLFPGAEECMISKSISRRRGAVAPVAGFGSSDCRSGCAAHLYRLASAREHIRD